MAKRGLYGTCAGDENRSGSAVVLDHYSENDLIEGHEASILRSMLQDKRFIAARDYMEKLRRDGWSKTRIDCVYSKASFGVKF